MLRFRPLIALQALGQKFPLMSKGLFFSFHGVVVCQTIGNI
nr:MAG TPA: hypothetical protein [Caudoviricetes sp.]